MKTKNTFRKGSSVYLRSDIADKFGTLIPNNSWVTVVGTVFHGWSEYVVISHKGSVAGVVPVYHLSIKRLA